MADSMQVKEITAKLEQGVKDLFNSDTYANYLKTMSRFHKYSTRNTLLIHLQKPDATLVAGFTSWQNKFERNVKKGEKAIKIFAPAPFTKREEKEKLDPDTRQPIIGEDGTPVVEYTEQKIARFKIANVFDVSQTDGKPLPTLVQDLTGNVEQYEAFMDALREVSPLPIVFEPMEEGKDGYCRFGEQIGIREGMSEIQTVCAVIHEMTHDKLHDLESLRLLDENAQPKDRRTEEVEAESVSYAVCQYFGIETSANSFGYLAEWSRGKELKELNASLDTIRKTSAEMIDAIDGKFQEIVKERNIAFAIGEQQMSLEMPEAAITAETELSAPEMPLADVLNNREEMIRRILDYSRKMFTDFNIPAETQERDLVMLEADYQSATMEGLREAYLFHYPNDPPVIEQEAAEMNAENNNIINGAINNEPPTNKEKPIREQLAAMEQAETLDAKYDIAFRVLVDTLCANEELLAVAATGADWQRGTGRNAVHDGGHYETLIDTYSAELVDLLADKQMTNKLHNTVKGEVYRRLDAIAYDRFILDEYADVTKSGRLDTYETPYPEDSENTGVLVHLTEQLPDGDKHDYGYIFGYDPDDNRDHAINNYLSLKSFSILRESVFGKPESTITLNYKETEPVGSTVLRRLLFNDGQFNRELKRTRVDVLPPMGKYSLYAQHLSGVIGDDTLIHVGTDSGFLVSLGVSLTRFEERFFEAQIDSIFEKAPKLLDDALADPEKFARYDWAAISGRIEDAEQHNVIYKGIKSEKDREKREEIAASKAAADKEAKHNHIEQIKTNAGIIESGGNFKVETVQYTGKNNLLELFALYDIDVPLATKGWFNNKLVSFEIKENGSLSYRSYQNKGRRTSYMGDTAVKKLLELRAAITAIPIAEKLAQKGLLTDEKPERSDGQNNETMNGGENMQYSELQEKGFEYAKRHAHLPLDERLNIIAQTFGVKSASVFIQPCTGKYRGQSDIMLKLENGGSMGIGMHSNATARKDSTINECVNNTLARYNPEIVAETKTRAAVAIKAREAEDNANAERRGLKPYKFLNVELSDGGDDNRHTGWYYATIAVDNKVFGFVESGLSSDIGRGELTDTISRANYFVAGGLKDTDVDFVFNNVGHSSIRDSYTVEMSKGARERAENTLAELSQTPSLTPNDKDFWQGEIAAFLAANDGKMELNDLELPPTGNHGGLGKFFEVFGENTYKKEFAFIVAQENTKRTGEPWIAFTYCEGGAYRPDFFKTPTAMPFAEADKFIRGYEPKVREILDGGYDKLDITVYFKRGDNEVHSISDRYDIGDSKNVSGFYNVLKAETDFYYTHPEIYGWKDTDENFAKDKELAYSDIEILKKAVTAEYPYVEIEKVIRYAGGDRLDQKVFNKGEILPLAEADNKIITEEKAIRDKNIQKYGSPGDGDEELGIAVHFKLPGENEASVHRFSYLLGDFDETRSGLLKHLEMGAAYLNLCISEGNYGNVNATLGGKTPDDAIRLAAEYTTIYETLRDGTAEPVEKAVAEQIAVVDMTLPDPSWTVAEMNEYGYTEPDMFPLSVGRAVELFDADHPIYMLYQDNTEALALDRDEIITFSSEGFCGITKADWEMSPIRAAQLAIAANSEGSRESDLLHGNGNQFGIYQLKSELVRSHGLISIDELQSYGIDVQRKNYELVYTAPITERIEFLSDRYPVINNIFTSINAEHPAEYAGRDLIIGDIIALKYNGDFSSHYIDNAGFIEIDGFLGEERAQLPEMTAQNAEIGASDTLSQVGTRSEEYSGKTVAELEADVNAGKAISLMDLSEAVNAEKKNEQRIFVVGIPKDKQKTRPSTLMERLEEGKRKAAQGGHKPTSERENDKEVRD